MKDKKNKNRADDDGRVIAPMNIEGMPWHGTSAECGQPCERREQNPANQPEEQEPLTKRQFRSALKGALAAALLICGVMGLAAFLFILFSVHVWFK